MEPRSEPQLGTTDTVLRREAYQSLQPVKRPEYWGVDRDPAARPGVPMEREPQPWPNTRYPPEHQAGEPASPLHGRSNKSPVPVFGTAVPLRGLSGVIKKIAYRSPDHRTRHWLLLMLGDRVDAWTHAFRPMMLLAIPLAAIALVPGFRRLIRG
ncbi:MAG: hypothetical protein QM765_35265 [Myxococcales bacterium]